MFAEDVILEITRAAQGLGIEPAALLAVADVESAGIAFAAIGGRREPLIRFEAHYFDRRLSEKNRALAREKGLAAPVAGAIANPKTQSARWRMLEQAAAIDAKAAYESVSWGLGQVMGAHWAWLGYASVDALVAEARSGVAGQARLMALYIDKAGLAPSLRSHNWPTFARGYNGPAYAQNGYDLKIAAAYNSYAKGELSTPVGPSLLQGVKGRGRRGSAAQPHRAWLSAGGGRRFRTGDRTSGKAVPGRPFAGGRRHRRAEDAGGVADCPGVSRSRMGFVVEADRLAGPAFRSRLRRLPSPSTAGSIRGQGSGLMLID